MHSHMQVPSCISNIVAVFIKTIASCVFDRLHRVPHESGGVCAHQGIFPFLLPLPPFHLHQDLYHCPCFPIIYRHTSSFISWCSALSLSLSLSLSLFSVVGTHPFWSMKLDCETGFDRSQLFSPFSCLRH